MLGSSTAAWRHLAQPIEGEDGQTTRVQNGLAKRTYLLPFAADPIIGIERLKSLS
jgi:hypothetical protein